MKQLLFLLASYCWLGSTLITQAAVFERDWKTPGDGLLTYDDVNGREWLDLSETLLAIHGGFDFIVSQTGPGEKYGGFLPATSDDVISLAQSAGIDTSTFDLVTNELAIRNLISLMKKTSSPAAGPYTRGLLDEIDIKNNLRFKASFFFSSPGAGLSIFSRRGDDLPARHTGVFLYRNAVPEPTTVLLSVCSLMLFMLKRDRHF